ncbi:MAG: HD domain-containing protein [Clostridia bacterium]|nr:HD domain-containing protein [Clostridia bacterium]
MENMNHVKLVNVFQTFKDQNPSMSLDELLYAVYKDVKSSENELFETLRSEILEANGINEFEYYTKDVNEDLKKYIKNDIFPKYDLNDKGHGIIHIIEVIRRSFALNDTLKLGLDKNMIYAIASYHDLGKYINSDIHEKIAADVFINDANMNRFFTNQQRIIIKEAIEDHRSSKEGNPRTIYGELISSADRNTRIKIVFIRSFFVAHERTPDMIIEDYLDFTFHRLSKRYSEENPENMFLEDDIYRAFLKDIRELLKHETQFKDKYCEINHITSRQHRVSEEQGEINYTIGKF